MKHAARLTARLALLVLVLSSCSNTATTPAAPVAPTVDVAAIQTKTAQDVIAQLTANAPTATPTLVASPTPASSPTPELPTKTPTPAPTSTPEFQSQTQKIGPVLDTLYDSQYSVEITLKGIEWLKEDGFKKPRAGDVYVVASLEIKNLGPGDLRSVGLPSFQVKDAKGAIRSYEMLPSTIDTCQFSIVDLVSGGSIEGCATFEVPAEGKVELIFAPFQYEGLKPGRYISFVLREN